MILTLVLFTVIGIMGDILLNFMSLLFPSNTTLRALRPYWSTLGDGIGCLSAGLTTLVAGILVLIISGCFGVRDIYGILGIAFLLGFVGDLILGRSGIFGSSLDTWYLQE